MNGAESLIRTLVSGDVDVCFANPGTSEMHFVAALDRVPEMRCVLGLFEGVVTGAADGYYRMAQRPAATLLHLGPGLANGIANLHNAKKAKSGIVNVVGQHALYHIECNAPLTADIEGLSRPVSDWVKTSESASAIADDAAAAIIAATGPSPVVATLILPADAAWSETSKIGNVVRGGVGAPFRPEAVEDAARVLREAPNETLLLLGGGALTGGSLDLVEIIAARAGCAVLAQTFSSVIACGGSRYAVRRLPYVIDQAVNELSRFRHIILVDAEEPVAFFAHPSKPSRLASPTCQFHPLTFPGEKAEAALGAIALALGAKQKDRPRRQRSDVVRPSGAITLTKLGQAVAAAIPAHAIVVDEAITTGRAFFEFTQHSPEHDWLQNMGGSIGYSTPVATGAAIACPDRKVICMVGDGSAMYTFQSLWTQAREGLDVVTIVFANRGYQILKGEFANVGAGAPGARALEILDIDRPTLDFVSLSRGMGVPAEAVDTIDDFSRALAYAVAECGPRLIEVRM